MIYALVNVNHTPFTGAIVTPTTADKGCEGPLKVRMKGLYFAFKKGQREAFLVFPAQTLQTCFYRATAEI